MYGNIAALTITVAALHQLELLTERDNMYKKTTTTVEEFFDSTPPAPPLPMGAPKAINPKALKPVIRLDVPLMIKLLEYAKDDAKTDIELHQMAERMMELCEYGEVLEMDDYGDIVEIVEVSVAPTAENKPPAPPAIS